MKKEYDFSKDKQGAVVPKKEKTRINIYLDNDVLEEFRKRAEEAGRGYQNLIVCYHSKPPIIFSPF